MRILSFYFYYFFIGLQFYWVFLYYYIGEFRCLVLLRYVQILIQLLSSHIEQLSARTQLLSHRHNQNSDSLQCHWNYTISCKICQFWCLQTLPYLLTALINDKATLSKNLVYCSSFDKEILLSYVLILLEERK